MEAPRTPAQWYATVAGIFLLAVGVLALILGSTNFGTAAAVDAEEFILWRMNGWDTIAYIVFGAFGLLAASRVDAARTYALAAGVFFAVVAVWGFIDGNDVFGLMAVDTTDNITNAVIGGLGLVLAMLPESKQRAAGVGERPRQRGGGYASQS